MTDIKRVGDIEINQDMTFQKKEWAFERWGWIFMLVMVVAALLGLFGQGPLSDATAENGTLQVEYARFDRLLASSQFQVHIDSQQAQDGEVRLQFDRELLSFYNVQRIIPEPEGTELSPDQITYIFKTGQGQGSLKVSYNLQAIRLGSLRGKIGLENGPAVNIRQFIYP